MGIAGRPWSFTGGPVREGEASLAIEQGGLVDAGRVRYRPAGVLSVTCLSGRIANRGHVRASTGLVTSVRVWSELPSEREALATRIVL